MNTSILKPSLLLLFISVFLTTNAQEALEEEAIEFGKRVTIQSKILDEERTLMIYVPEQNTAIGAKETFPVLYLLDGGGHFYSVAGMVRQLSVVNGNTAVPKMIIVGITNTNRTRDLTPTKGDPKHPFVAPGMAEASGGGDKFIKFIEEEVFPFVEKNYPTQAYRTFIGHSFGGLTVMNTWLKYTDLFNAYVAIDPSMWWSNEELAKEIMATPIDERFEGVSLYYAFANTMEEGMDTTQAKADKGFMTGQIRSNLMVNNYLRQQSGKHLRYRGKYYAYDSHGSVPLISEYDALRFIFDFYEMKMGPKDFMDPNSDLAGKIDKHYKVITQNFGYEVLPPENFVNMMGYQLMQMKQMKKSEAMFKLNVNNYPKSYNVYDSLADCYIAIGDKENAKSNLKKSIELNKESPSKAKLEQLENDTKNK